MTMFDLGPEATAAVVGAGVGVTLSSVVQLIVAAVATRRARREAAGLIHWELGTNYAAAVAAAASGADWATPEGTPRRSAWEGLAGELLGRRRRRREQVTQIAAAYSSLDDVAYSVAHGNVLTGPLLASALLSIQTGVYQAGRIAGYSKTELTSREV